MSDCSLIANSGANTPTSFHDVVDGRLSVFYNQLLPTTIELCDPNQNNNAVPTTTQDYTVAAGDCLDKIIQRNYRPATSTQVLDCRTAIAKTNNINNINNIRLGSILHLPIMIGALTLASYRANPADFYPHSTDAISVDAKKSVARTTFSFSDLDFRSAKARGAEWLNQTRGTLGKTPLSADLWRQIFAIAGLETVQSFSSNQAAHRILACVGQIASDWQSGSAADHLSADFREAFLQRAQSLVEKFSTIFPQGLRKQFEIALYAATNSIFKSIIFTSGLSASSQSFLAEAQKNLATPVSVFYQNNVVGFNYSTDDATNRYFDLYMQSRCCDCSVDCLDETAKGAAKHFTNLNHEGLNDIYIAMKYQAKARGFDPNTGTFNNAVWSGYVATLSASERPIAKI